MVPAAAGAAQLSLFWKSIEVSIDVRSPDERAKDDIGGNGLQLRGLVTGFGLGSVRICHLRCLCQEAALHRSLDQIIRWGLWFLPPRRKTPKSDSRRSYLGSGKAPTMLQIRGFVAGCERYDAGPKPGRSIQ